MLSESDINSYFVIKSAIEKEIKRLFDIGGIYIYEKDNTKIIPKLYDVKNKNHYFINVKFRCIYDNNKKWIEIPKKLFSDSDESIKKYFREWFEYTR